MFFSNPGVSGWLLVKILKSSLHSTMKFEELYTVFSSFQCILNRDTEKSYYKLFHVSRFMEHFALNSSTRPDKTCKGRIGEERCSCGGSLSTMTDGLRKAHESDSRITPVSL